MSRWGVVAVLAGSMLGACSWTVEERAADEEVPGVPELVDDVVETDEVPLRLVADAVRLPGGEADVDGEVLIIPAYPGSALVAFDLAGVDRACTASATLTIDQLGDPPDGIEAWVSLEDGLPVLADGASLGQNVIARGSPGVSGVAGDGTFEWDVTELVAWTAERQPDQPLLVLVLKPTYDDIWSAPAIELGASEGGRPATLTLEQRTGC